MRLSVAQGAANEDQEEAQDPGLVHGVPDTAQECGGGSSWQS